MGKTLIDFAGEYGTPYAVYEAEQDGEGKINRKAETKPWLHKQGKSLSGFRPSGKAVRGGLLSL
jgi:hypothetical protein